MARKSTNPNVRKTRDIIVSRTVEYGTYDVTIFNKAEKITDVITVEIVEAYSDKNRTQKIVDSVVLLDGFKIVDIEKVSSRYDVVGCPLEKFLTVAEHIDRTPAIDGDDDDDTEEDDG